jgi:hypothetical protein
MDEGRFTISVQSLVWATPTAQIAVVHRIIVDENNATHP